MLLTRAGRFRAETTSASVEETGQNKLATVILSHRITDEWNGEEWEDIADECFEIRSYHYLEKKNGDLNEFAINALKEALGWDGQNLDFFSGELPPAQITVEMDEYQGRVRAKVAYINHYDSTGGGTVEYVPEKASAIANRLGSRLRALSGGSAAGMPARRPSAPPAATAKRKAPAKAPSANTQDATAVADAPAPMSMDEAWGVFCEKRAGMTEDALREEWFDLIGRFGKDTDAMTEQDWGKIAAIEPRAAAKDDLPF